MLLVRKPFVLLTRGVSVDYNSSLYICRQNDVSELQLPTPDTSKYMVSALLPWVDLESSVCFFVLFFVVRKINEQRCLKACCRAEASTSRDTSPPLHLAFCPPYVPVKPPRLKLGLTVVRTSEMDCPTRTSSSCFSLAKG